MLPPLVWLCPTLLTIIEDQHRHHRTGMLGAFALAGARLRGFAPRAIVAVTARWRSEGAFLVDAGRRHRTLTDYSGFGVEVRHDCDGHPALARAIVAAGQRAGVRVAPGQRGADSGVSVPLHLLHPEHRTAVVPVSLSNQGADACRAFGAILRRALEAWEEPVAFVVGGNLSFNEHAWRLGREVPETAEVDEQVLEGMSQGDWTKLDSLDVRRFERAQPEAGLRHLHVLRGFIGDEVRGDVRCYQASPGIGAALVEWVLDPVAAAALPIEAELPPPPPAPRPAQRLRPARPARTGSFRGAAARGGTASRASAAGRGGAPSRGGVVSRGGAPSRGGAVSRGGAPSRGGAASRGAASRGRPPGRPTSGSRTPRANGPSRAPRRGPKPRG